ncbi:MAG: N-acetylhexosamine 1-kinase [Bacteroidota bacterium]|jgi:hypothetical protein
MTSINWSEWGRPAPIALTPVTGGLINESYRAEFGSGEVLFAQRVNRSVFRDLEAIEQNLILLRASPSSVLAVNPIPRQDGSIHDAEGWRIQPWIDESAQQVSAYACGQFWGKFNRLLNERAAPWKTVLPDFHSAALRWEQWTSVRQLVPRAYLELKSGLEDFAPMFLTLELKLIPAVQHHDAKRANMLRSAQGFRAIDLDTLQPGYLGSDFADLVRSMASRRAEDDPKGNSAEPEIVRELWDGYLNGWPDAAAHEGTMLRMPAYLSWVQALRFATDAAHGSTYYRIDYPEHNWVRAQNQLELVRSLLKLTRFTV